MMKLSRRRMLALTSAALATGCGGGGGGGSSAPYVPPAPPPPPPPPPDPLSVDPIKDIAAGRNMRFGTAVDVGYAGSTYDDTNYRGLMEEHCNILVAENKHKWEAIRPSEAEFTFGDGDTLVNYANAEGMDFRFHTLLWEVTERYPAWLESGYDFGADPAAEAERLLRDHIRTCADHYRADMTSWDVINEAVNNGSGEYRSTPLSNAMGGMEAVLDVAFHTAREELPDAQLVYNDFMIWSSNSTHRDGVLRLLEGLLDRGTPIDALGVQSHLWGGNSGGFDNDETAWRSFLDEVTGMGLDLVITELDVDDSSVPGDVAARDARVADVTSAYLDLMFDYQQVRDVMVWGLVNGNSWLQSFRPRDDGAPVRPLPFDDDYNPTPMAEAIYNAFEATTARPAL